MTNKHSKLPPSSAARRMACPGSREMEERYGHNEESEASKEGQLAHELAAAFLSHSSQKFDNVTEEMYEGAKLYYETVNRFIDLSGINIEQKIGIQNVHPECWGTPDAWGTNENELHIFDYKFGFTSVQAFENWQLLEYACGIIYTIVTTMGLTLQSYNVYLHIVQPRDYTGPKHKVWHLTAQELETYRQRLIISESLSFSLDAPLKVSEQCKYCKARYACPALQRAALGAIETTHRAPTPDLTPVQMGTELKLLHEARDILEYRITALETEVEHHIQSGINIPHYELKPTESRLNWFVDKNTVVQLGDVLGINLRKEDVLTPTQAIKAGIPEEAVLVRAERKSSLKLSKVNLNKIREVFGK